MTLLLKRGAELLRPLTGRRTLRRGSGTSYRDVDLKESLNKANVGRKIRVKGWIKSVRKMKNSTFADVDDGLSASRLQVVGRQFDDLKLHEAVAVSGTLKESDHPKQEVELMAESVESVNSLSLPVAVSGTSTSGEDEETDDESDDYPFAPRKTYPDDFTRRFPMFRAKMADFAALTRIRSSLSFAIHSFFRSRDFVQIHTPVLTSSDCEGAGEVFSVNPGNPEVLKAMRKSPETPDDAVYFDKPVYLTVSGQLHLEAVCNGISKVYSFAPAFRAEMGISRRHLSEFSMVEAEIGFVEDLRTVLDLAEDLVKSPLKQVMEDNGSDVRKYVEATKSNKNSKNAPDLQLVERLLKEDFVTMTYDEASEILTRHKFKTAFNHGASLGKEHEMFLAEKHCNNRGVFVTEWPKEIKPFYSRLDENQKSLAVDLIFPKVGELCGGSLREYRASVLEERIKECNSDRRALNWYLLMRKAGSSPTGGFGLGFERLVQFLLGVNNIRDTLPFPRAPHSCRL